MQMKLLTRTTMRKKVRAGALTLLRVGTGIIMTTHGWMKLTDLAGTHQTFASLGIPFPDAAAYLAVAGELFGGLGLIVGLLTPIAAFGVLATMIAAIAFVHWPSGLLAQNNGFEYPLTVGLVALYFLVRGAGPVSLDAWWANRRGSHGRVPGQHPLEVGA
jgi:putative oxidoreductase